MDSPLRVAVIAPIAWGVPPRHSGPGEQFVSLLTEGLVSRGVEVTRVATADSVTSARLSACVPRGYSEDPSLDPKVSECLHISALFERAGEFDLIHNSFDFLPLTYSGLVETPVITTVHGFSSERIVAVYEKYDERGFYVAISEADRHERLHYIATIHHGIDMTAFEARSAPGTYLLFFGRIHPDKGTAAAIDVAERAGLPLTIAGIIQDHEYFERFVEPRLDGERVRYIGPVGPEARGDLLADARALLHLIEFEEPFGYSVVEAMACGTPVIANVRGSMPEIVRHGEGGYLVHSLDEAVAAVHSAGDMDRLLVRASVERRFDVDRMVDEYLDVSRRVIAQRRAGRSRLEADSG